MFKTIVLAIAMLVCLQGVFAQQKLILIADYENKPNTDGWWKDNPCVKFSYNENPSSQLNKQTTVYL